MRIKQTRTYLFLTLIILFGINHSLSAQKIEVKGNVTDDQGFPIPGVSIMEKGTTNGVMTDFDGLYQIQASVFGTNHQNLS
mgnify:FL=1